MTLSRKISRATLAVAISASAVSVQAASFGVDARSLAMGNVSVATANIATAALANPSMLALQKQEDDFALLLPSVGIFIDDSDKLIDAVDTFQVDSNACIATNNPISPACTAATASFNNLVGKFVEPQVTGALALGVAGETFSYAISARADAILSGGIDGATVDTSPLGLQDPTKNIIELRGVQTKEVGVSIASKLELGGMNIAVGITPKVVNVESVIFQESAASLDTGTSNLLDENIINDLGSYTTIDAGVMLGIAENVQLGVVIKNLLSDELVDNTGITPVTLNFDTQLRAGVAFTGDIITLGVDLDLTENDPVISAPGAQKTQYLSVGAEIDAFDFAQLRVGMQKNTASGANGDALLTAGVGFWFGFTLDLSVITGDDVAGAYVQTGFRF